MGQSNSHRKFLWTTGCCSSCIVFLFVSNVTPIINVCLWNVSYMMDVRLLESVQQRRTRKFACVGHLIKKG